MTIIHAPLAVERARRLAMRATWPLRPIPDVVVLGAMKAGSTSFYQYLIQHPDLRGAVRKEVHFLDQHYDRGIRWYRGQFPLSLSQRNWLAVESTPYYLSCPEAPKRALMTNPRTKFVVLLRDPVDRAISQWKHRTRKGDEDRSLAEVVEQEGRLSDREIDLMSKADWHQHFRLILAHGYYETQLRRWFTLFDRRQFLIFESGDFFSSPQAALAETFEFLSLPPFRVPDLAAVNVGDDRLIESTVALDLATHYEGRNAALFELLGRKFPWRHS